MLKAGKFSREKKNCHKTPHQRGVRKKLTPQKGGHRLSAIRGNIDKKKRGGWKE